MSDAKNKPWPPRGLTGWLARRVAGGLAPDDPRTRMALGELEGYVSTGLSIVLSAVKAALGWISGSLSLLADSVNNLADIGSSLIIALGFRWSRRPRDRQHPFGHGRIETVTALILSVFLIAVALQVAKSGIARLLRPEPIHAPVWLVATIGVTVVVKTWLAIFARRLARATHSPVLDADAWNHLFDIASTLLVVLALIGGALGWQTVDGWAGLGVSLFIGYTGARFARDSINTLIGEAPDAAALDRIRALAHAQPGVFGVHDILQHTYGDVRIISLHIEVDAAQTLMAAHELAERVEKLVAAELGAKVVVHVDPVDRHHPEFGRVEDALRSLVAGHAGLVDFHDLRLTRAGGQGYDLAVDLVTRAEVPSKQYAPLMAGFSTDLRKRLPDLRQADLGVETECASEHEHRAVFHPPARNDSTTSPTDA